VLEVVRVVELAYVHTRDGSSPLRFRIEILRDGSRLDCFRARLMRWEPYRLRPSFSASTGEADEEVLVVDEFWNWREHSASSADSCAG
jgi:hypothetical protein